MSPIADAMSSTSSTVGFASKDLLDVHTPRAAGLPLATLRRRRSILRTSSRPRFSSWRQRVSVALRSPRLSAGEGYLPAFGSSASAAWLWPLRGHLRRDTLLHRWTNTSIGSRRCAQRA